MPKAALIRDIQQLQATVATRNGSHGEDCYCDACKEARVKELDSLFQRIQAAEPWPTGKIDETTQPEFCHMIHEIMQNLTGQDDKELPDRNGRQP
jgi:hypothetical protein